MQTKIKETLVDKRQKYKPLKKHQPTFLKVVPPSSTISVSLSSKIYKIET